MSRLVATRSGVEANPHRFRLSRAGVLNVWQYDDQVFDLADGRLLLRGANGAGKSKTLEMLLPFVLDGDKSRLTASGRHHTSLLWLLLENDAYDGQNRTGYVWVEFAREGEDGHAETLTCAVGMRASRSAKQATAWYFTTPNAVGAGLDLEDAGGPLSRERCRESVHAAGGAFFESPRAYKEHVGRLLFGLDGSRYDELLRLLYWLRQPQVGEEIEPGRLAEILAVSLPQLDEAVVRRAGDTFDQLTEFGEEIGRRQRAAAAIAGFCDVYQRYSATVVAGRASALLAAQREQTTRARELARRTRALDDVAARLEAAQRRLVEVNTALESAQARLSRLQASPEARSQQVLHELRRRADDLRRAAEREEQVAIQAAQRAADQAAGFSEETTSLRGDLDAIIRSAQTHAARLVQHQIPATLPVPAIPVPDDDMDPQAIHGALIGQQDQVSGARAAISESLAVVQVVERAAEEAAQAVRDRAVAEQRSGEADESLTAAEKRLVDITERVAQLETEFAASLHKWRADPRGVGVRDLDELTAPTLSSLAGDVRADASPTLEQLRAEESAARAAEQASARTLDALRESRAAIEAERDPAPPQPAWSRTARPATDGASLWLLVDFIVDVDESTRAALEAALEASGLLDAWVRRDGTVLEPGRFDTVLPLGDAVTGRSLVDVLVPAVPDGGPVSADVVRGVLHRVGLAAGASCWIGADGAWQLGPLTGRAQKPVAQYIGASARAAERARRLGDVDERIAVATSELASARAARAVAGDRAAAIESWLTAVPSPGALLAAWVSLDERTAECDRHRRQAAKRAEEARAARAAAAKAGAQLDALAAQHAVPSTREGLAARRSDLHDLDTALDQHAQACRRQSPQVDRWSRQRDGLHQLRVDEREAATAAEEAGGRASTVEQEYAVLAEMLGAEVAELERRLQQTEAALQAARREAESTQREVGELREQRGVARRAGEEAQLRLAEQAPVLMEALSDLAALSDVPGLLMAAVNREVSEAESVAFAEAAGAVATGSVPKAVLELTRRLGDLTVERGADQNDVYSAHRELAAGDAADTEPRVLPMHGALAVLARDDVAEDPVVVLRARLEAAVVADQQLLTDREREYFEQHLLGDLGDALRKCQSEAQDLVAAMNGLLEEVRTSQGIRVRLDWRLRDDVPREAREAVELLAKPLGMLLPDEQSRLRDALHALIDTSRLDAPELGYGEHLARALDYRRWSQFRVRIHRPEGSAEWSVLGRRTPLSQGEQKVVCYLPLFAAAAAHFTSVAGATPHAPRFILLDDAFPKIDVRTHPELFGLLVKLDLDFVVTSERLWGDHATVPSLAIYEALRSPTERGIAQYKHLWDGSRLQAVGL